MSTLYTLFNDKFIDSLLHCADVTLNSLHVIDPEHPNKYKQDERPCKLLLTRSSEDITNHAWFKVLFVESQSLRIQYLGAKPSSPQTRSYKKDLT